MESRLEDVNIGGVMNEVVNSLEIGSVIFYVEVIWNIRGGHGG